ncbi:hypothetical protein G7066_14430 [Leucobacter coleopterorum]|uniref:Transglycosylase SLT domain-containing protein n=1 Tax=Leucobacter coleopterorum TaxID=2714933 RepID=A0ABX6K2V1_9MICO|nr:hypothetical protein G7066_14430 [Leucobacter coleopterorum]
MIPASQLDNFENAWFNWCLDHPQAVEPIAMNSNRGLVKDLVVKHDPFITAQAKKLGIYKAMALTPLIWESLAINPLDDLADALVVKYYAALSEGKTPAPGTRSDSSTGVCQMFAATCIEARNWAKAKGYITDGPYRENDWRDMWEVWLRLRSDEEFAIQSAIFYMMCNAENHCGVPPVKLRGLNPSEVARMCMAYNADMSDPSYDAMIYGREKAQLFYLIRKWHETFR